jgi:hypothetical protein
LRWNISKLDKAIKEYATTIANDQHTERIEAHKNLCQLLNIKVDNFKPFEFTNLLTFPLNEIDAERILRKAINELNLLTDRLKGENN